MAIKAQNEIYSDIIGFLDDVLKDLNKTFAGYGFNKWQILQLKQPIKLTEITPTIYVSITTRHRRGWQYRKYITDLTGFKKTENFKQELDVQISALRRRELTDTATTLNSADVLEYLKTHILNPYTLQDLRNKGYIIYQPSDIQSPDFFDDSDNFEFMPFFNVTFILDQSLISPQSVINEYTIQIEGV